MVSYLLTWVTCHVINLQTGTLGKNGQAKVLLVFIFLKTVSNNFYNKIHTNKQPTNSK